MQKKLLDEDEYQRTHNLWNIANASSHWRGTNQPKKAIKLTDDIHIIDIHEGFRIEDSQYEKFKSLMIEAEQRGLVKIQQQGQQWDAKLS
jgi:hypothetical protein